MKLTEAWDRYIKSKSWKDKRRKNVEQMFLNILLFLGDQPVDSYRQEDIEQALSSIAKLPQRNRKPYSSMLLEDTVGLDVPPEQRISDKTVKEHLKVMIGLFSEYLVKKAKILSSSPTDRVKYKVEVKRFGAFSDLEVTEILRDAKTKPEWFYWFAMLGAYTGARRSEIAGLTRADFGVCSDSKRTYFRITEGKTSSAVRIVPLSRELMESGFLKYLGSIEQERIFETAYRNPNRVTDLFGSLITNATDAYGDRLVFHSLRHTFITKARMAGVSTSLVQQYVGHSMTGGGVTDRYTHRYTVERLAEVCDSVNYLA
ncbi:MAG: Tyrosine recombinase XerC [Marinobacterium sp. xm-d-530]|nr:MAG: Tyrosine recombinase XerC [Marinobacterium sp. xm-d-530]